MKKKLLFVYNADAGLFASLTDFAHKIVSPETYSCNLCKITYGNLTMKKEWKDFLDSLEYEKAFLHRDEFLKEYSQFKGAALPCVFVSDEGGMRQIVSADEINALGDVGGLKNLLGQKLER